MEIHPLQTFTIMQHNYYDSLQHRAPPLGVLKTYKLGSSTIDLYTPADPDFL